MHIHTRPASMHDRLRGLLSNLNHAAHDVCLQRQCLRHFRKFGVAALHCWCSDHYYPAHQLLEPCKSGLGLHGTAKHSRYHTWQQQLQRTMGHCTTSSLLAAILTSNDRHCNHASFAPASKHTKGPSVPSDFLPTEHPNPVASYMLRFSRCHQQCCH